MAPDVTFGYSDQILTSMLFGLPTTLDATTQKKMERYYELVEMKDHGGRHQEYEELKLELMLRVPPVSQSYEEKHDEQVSMAQMLKELGGKLVAAAPGSSDALLKRADTLLKNLKGDKA